MNQIRISENFLLKEFECKDGSHQVRIKRELLEKLQKLREEAGQPVIITSGYRNPSHNARVGGSPTSRHLTGEAADIRIPGPAPGRGGPAGGRGGIYRHRDLRQLHPCGRASGTRPLARLTHRGQKYSTRRIMPCP
jgi:hypothetical protein